VTPTVAILFTGGTISMRIDAQSGSAVPAMRGDDILAHVPQLSEVADIELEDVAQLPGPHVTPEHMWRLARRVAAWLERPDVDGVVVTHGTDTLEETAYFLDIALRTDKPVVLVGAIRTMSEPSWDGPANLVHAVKVAGAPDSHARGVMVAMNEQILSAREVEKVHTEAAASFQSREFGPVGVVDAGVVRYLRSSPREGAWHDTEADGLLRVRRVEPDVDLIKVAAGADGRFVRCSIASGAKGLVLEALGRGNVPPEVMPGVHAWTEAGRPVVIASRSLRGRVLDTYAYPGGGHELREIGAIFADHLAGQQARIELMLAIGVWGDDVAGVRRVFETPPR
jgi:L-asparaginase